MQPLSERCTAQLKAHQYCGGATWPGPVLAVCLARWVMAMLVIVFVQSLLT